MTKPIVTVGLPVWDSAPISWLPLEGLIRQDTTVPWQLVIAEEREGASMGALLDDYKDRLFDAGCVGIKYISLRYRLPLSTKYKKIYEQSKGEIFVMQAADDWSHKNRIQNAYNAMNAGAEWFHSRRGMFYNIVRGGTIVLDKDIEIKYHPCGPGMAWLTDLMKWLPDKEVRRSVDRWLYTSFEFALGREMEVHWEGDDDLLSLYTHGANKISRGRSKYFEKIEPPFRTSRKKGLSVLPKSVADRLRKLRGMGL